MGTSSQPDQKRLFVLHWYPLEQYPPAMNLLNYFGQRPDYRVAACSTHNDRSMAEFSNSSVQLIRTRFPSRALSRLRRAFAFIMYPVCAVWNMLRFRPDVVLYIEPHSSLPAALFRLVGCRHRLFIHYHEYYEPEQFCSPGMRLVALYHRIEEQLLYKRAEWISQTNSKRCELFSRDQSSVKKTQLQTLPNYPPASWANRLQSWPTGEGEALKFVYVGALSTEDTFVASFIRWIETMPDASLTLDIYSNNMAESARQLLAATNDSRITHHQVPIPYHDLPSVLSQYHIGLILYKANTTNYVYNASNKLFEYLICGLDVVYPDTMLGVRPYAKSDTYPRVMEVDFTNRDTLCLKTMRARNELPERPWTESCESALALLETAISEGPSGG